MVTRVSDLGKATAWKNSLDTHWDTHSDTDSLYPLLTVLYKSGECLHPPWTLPSSCAFAGEARDTRVLLGPGNSRGEYTKYNNTIGTICPKTLCWYCHGLILLLQTYWKRVQFINNSVYCNNLL